MRYAILFFALAAGCGYLAATRGGPDLLLAWAALSSAVVGSAYARSDARPIGKRPDGTIGRPSLVALMPYFLYAWGVWRARAWITGEAVADEVAPGVWVGRRPTDADLPPDTRLVVDLAAEFPAAADVRRRPGYLSVPTLDGTATSPAAMADALARLESAGGVAYIHCAFGHGRSAALAAALIVRRGLAADVPDAEALMRRRRPGIRLKRSQRAAAAAAAVTR